MEVKSHLICEPNIGLDCRQHDDWIANMHSYVLCKNVNGWVIVVHRKASNFTTYIMARTC